MTTGSSYETYEKTHHNYDKTRAAVGSEQIVRRLNLQSGAKQLRILDAGCGTGVHLLALQQAGFENLTGVDASSTGLAVAGQKLGDAHKVNLVCSDIRSMPFAQATFDVILLSFVLQHLPHKDEDELQEATEKLFSHLTSLLSPGGQLIIVTCSKQQMSADDGCMWYYKYFPQAAAKLAGRFLDIAVLKDLLGKSGMAPSACLEEALEQTYFTDASLEATGPLDSNWRSGDSLFALCEKDAPLFEQNLAALEADIKSGAVVNQIAAVKNRVAQIKQGVLLFAGKAA